ncbi:hypothetical protein [Lacticaseibacillus sp. GG6-2]
MMPTREDMKSTIAAVPKKTWKIMGGALLFGLIMRLATSVSRKR